MLRELQSGFRHAILSRDDGAAAALARHGLVGSERFPIYRNNTFASLIGVMEAAYPAVRRFAGDDNFRFAAAEFIAAHPPRTPRLHGYGEEFPTFLAGLDKAVEDFPFLPDLARLEWEINESYFAPGGEALIAEHLAAVPAEDYGRLALSLHPAARLIRSDYPVWHLWDNDTLPDPAPEEGDHVLVYRPGARVDLVLLSPGDHAMLTAIDGGAALAEAAAAAAAAEPGFDLSASLGGHLTRGTFGADFALTGD